MGRVEIYGYKDVHVKLDKTCSKGYMIVEGQTNHYYMSFL